MAHASPATRKLIQYTVVLAENFVVGIVNATLLFRLGNMQLEGVGTAIGGTLALLAALTSLMFNRARAYPNGSVQRRSFLAAELCLRATILVAVGGVLTALIFPLLASAGYSPISGELWPTQMAPILLAFPPMLFFAVGSLILLRFARVIKPSLTQLRARDLSKAIGSKQR